MGKLQRTVTLQYLFAYMLLVFFATGPYGLYFSILAILVGAGVLLPFAFWPLSKLYRDECVEDEEQW